MCSLFISLYFCSSDNFFILTIIESNFHAVARSCSAMHPEEREEADVGARMALVEIVRESRALVERSSNRRSVESANGEKKKCAVFSTTYYNLLFSSSLFS